MTNWVTIKIPEETRDKAKEDSRTYEQIMQDGLEAEPVATEEFREKHTSQDVDREALAEDRQEQLEEVVYAATGDLATNESVREVASQLKDLETELQTLREAMQR